MKAKCYKKEEIDSNAIEEIANGILAGKNVVFPTETVYGIGANALDEVACKRIFAIKERDDKKPLIVLISDFYMLEKIVTFANQIERKLMEKFWPGALTIILKKNDKSHIASTVTANQSTIGVRMTSGKIARLLIQKAKVPIVAPSANLSGRPTGTKIAEIVKELGDRVDYILDCGDTKSETTSTLVEVKNDVIYVLREGKISIKELQQIAKVKVI